jgi:hypothetical protein
MEPHWTTAIIADKYMRIDVLRIGPARFQPLHQSACLTGLTEFYGKGPRRG